jgi:hypothetical protein
MNSEEQIKFVEAITSAEMTREEIDLMFGLLPEKYHKDKKKIIKINQRN